MKNLAIILLTVVVFWCLYDSCTQIDAFTDAQRSVLGNMLLILVCYFGIHRLDSH